MLHDFAAVLIFMVVGSVFVFASLLVGRLVRPRRPSKDKVTVYECGEPTIGTASIRYNSRFYSVALVYLLFDVEVVVLAPAALVLKEMARSGLGLVPLVAVLVFLGVLALGLAYEWFWGNLDWIRAADKPSAKPMPLPAEAPRADEEKIAAVS